MTYLCNSCGEYYEDGSDHTCVMKDNQRGLYQKYRIEKVDGTPVEGFKFVLSPESDQAALEALKMYQILTSNKVLAEELRRLINSIEGTNEKDVNKRLKHLEDCIEDARAYNGLYTPTHADLEWLISTVRSERMKKEKYIGKWAESVKEITERDLKDDRTEMNRYFVKEDEGGPFE